MMAKRGSRFLFSLGLLLCPVLILAQENGRDGEPDAEVFLGEHADAFQEVFFEALKQKGIENYDKEINLLLEAKRLEPQKAVVDYELAKAYLATRQLPLAQEHGIMALQGLPENYWALQLLTLILERQAISFEAIKGHIPFSNLKLQENLVAIYYKQQDYGSALSLLKEMKPSSFTERWSQKIRDVSPERPTTLMIVTDEQELETESNPMQDRMSWMSELLEQDNFKELLVQGPEAVEDFPTQPYFYYAYGRALNRTGQYREAISILETGLDFLLDDVALANKIYQELADANKALGNSTKANMYLSKIKSGL